MKSFNHSFLAVHDLILFPKIHSGIVSKQTPRKQDPRMLKTTRAPASPSHAFTKYVNPKVSKLRVLIATKDSSARRG